MGRPQQLPHRQSNLNDNTEQLPPIQTLRRLEDKAKHFVKDNREAEEEREEADTRLDERENQTKFSPESPRNTVNDWLLTALLYLFGRTLMTSRHRALVFGTCGFPITDTNVVFAFLSY